jgi:hypothetical protein
MLRLNLYLSTFFVILLRLLADFLIFIAKCRPCLQCKWRLSRLLRGRGRQKEPLLWTKWGPWRPLQAPLSG